MNDLTNVRDFLKAGAVYAVASLLCCLPHLVGEWSEAPLGNLGCFGFILVAGVFTCISLGWAAPEGLLARCILLIGMSGMFNAFACYLFAIPLPWLEALLVLIACSGVVAAWYGTTMKDATAES